MPEDTSQLESSTERTCPQEAACTGGLCLALDDGAGHGAYVWKFGGGLPAEERRALAAGRAPGSAPRLG